MERKRLGTSIIVLLLLLLTSSCTNDKKIVNSTSIPCGKLKTCIVEAINDREMSNYYRRINGNYPVFLVDSTYQCPQLFTFYKFGKVNNLVRLGHKSVDEENFVIIKIFIESKEQFNLIMTYKLEGVKMTRKYNIEENNILLVDNEVVEN